MFGLSLQLSYPVSRLIWKRHPSEASCKTPMCPYDDFMCVQGNEGGKCTSIIDTTSKVCDSSQCVGSCSATTPGHGILFDSKSEYMSKDPNGQVKALS